MVDVDVSTLHAPHCWLTTTGRVTARRHTAELRFVPADGGVFLLSGSGGLRQWCLDLEAEEQAVVRIGEHRFQARAAEVADPVVRAAALELFHDKYDVSDDRRQSWDDEANVYRLVFLREVQV
ncbi:nitroreductase/quinone reductase family protein [Salsipaludibacter albus]|uniref:nitroreductase/quinone reductase family protein n=1 Tax=Salsipaludibacter albus TaxID=2849650 RepID=UPI001EE490DD|nr:nitroreductase/quinone reductase family protein [Salsipaludibacter albus]MBY5163339.1 nitroreductase family deazaflavin-dependent oxidoreductase [Salsipaludibacter albus]